MSSEYVKLTEDEDQKRPDLYYPSEEDMEEFADKVLFRSIGIGFFDRIKRWFNWNLFNKAYCPRCDKEVKFKTRIYVIGLDELMPEDEIPLFMEEYCEECKLVVPSYGALIDVIEEEYGDRIAYGSKIFKGWG